MAAVNSLGAGSGLLTSDLLDKIVSSERAATDLRLNAKRAEVNAKISAVGAVRGALDSLSSAVRALNDPATFGATSASVSDPTVVSASSSTIAVAGTHSIEVSALAQSHVLRSEHFATLSSVVGTGTLTLRFGTTSYAVDGEYASFLPNADLAGATITIDSSNSTLGGVRDAINGANLGVKARVVDDGGGYRLVLSATGTGAAHSIEIVAAEGGVPGLARLAYNGTAHATGTNLTQTVAGGDAAAIVDGIAITRSTNAIAGVIDGVTLNLIKRTAGSPVTLAISANTQIAVDKVQAFVSSYNKAKGLADQLTAYNTKTSTGGLLLGDATLRGVTNQLRAALNYVVTQLPSTSARSLIGVGVRTDQGAGYQLGFDSNLLVSALTTDPQGVAGLFAAAGSVADPLLQLVTRGAKSQGGVYDVRVARLGTQATLAGASVPALAGASTIDATNDTLQVDVDGVTSGVITLARGTYATGAALAVELQSKINGDNLLHAGAASVAVSFDAGANQLRLGSVRYGSGSRIGILQVGTATTATLGLGPVDARFNRGVNVAGAINGVVATGSGQTLTVAAGALGATAGQLPGDQIAAGPITLDNTNSTFKVRIDGVESGVVQLAAQTYATGADLAIELQTKINADVLLNGAGQRVTVDFNGGGRFFNVFSNSVGRASSVAVTQIGSAASSALGLSVRDGLAGHDATQGDDPAAEIQVKVLGGGFGTRGAVTIVRGVSARLLSVLGQALDFNGSFDNQLATLNGRIAAIETEAAKVTVRINTLQTRLQRQFTAADTLISKLNNTSSFLQQQLNPNSKSNF